MSLFVKHVADKQHFLFFSDARVDIAMPSPCSAFSHAISVKAFRWRTRSDHVTRKALAARNNEACGQGNGRQSFRTVFRYHYKHWTREFCYWPFSHTRARNGLSVGDWPVYSPHPPPPPSPPHRQPLYCRNL